VEKMMDNFPTKFKKMDTAFSPAAKNLFSEGQGKKLDDKCKEIFHTWVAKGIFVAKRARPDTSSNCCALHTSL
jgi:hypothetical protein